MDYIKIISKLWSVIYDMRMYIGGIGNRSIEEIDERIEELDHLCRLYAQEDNPD